MVHLRHLVVALGLLAGCHAEKPAAAPAPRATGSAGQVEAVALAPGAKFPSFRVDRVDVAGTVGIPNGKVTIITFIATWNGPAQKSLPKLQEIYLQHAAKGLEIIAISVDDTVDGVREFGARNGAKYPFTWDKDRVIATKARPSHMPSTYILDRNAVVRFIHGGYHDGEADEIAREAASLL